MITVKSFCKVCNQSIDDSDLLVYSNISYHIKCVKCSVCNKKCHSKQQKDEFICISPGLFFCKDHYKQYKGSKNLPKNIQNDYHEKTKKNLVEVLFDPQNFSNKEIDKHQPEDIFITSDMIQKSFTINKPYECFVPTITYHFDISPEKIDFNKLKSLLGENFIICNVEAGSTFVRIALLESEQFSPNVKNRLQDFINLSKNKINSSIGKMIVGNLVDEPEITIPDDEKIQEFYNKPSINILQNTKELNSFDINKIKQDVLKTMKNDKTVKNWEFLFDHEKLLKEVERKVREDIKNNEFEMIIIGHTIMPNKFLTEYEKIKKSIPSKNIKETYLYHGSRLKNHQKILYKNFLVPGKDDFHQLDPGYYGKGIYATDDMFYATIYGNGYSILEKNEKTSVLCCKVIYNKSKVVEITDKSYYGVEFKSDIEKNYGIHHAIVGKNHGFWPVKKDSDDYIVAEEFVFANTYQIIPVSSFMIMRADHFILWKDDNIDNSENSNYLNEISKKIEVNVYSKKTSKEALELLRLKKKNQVKLITNAGKDQNGKTFIEKARKIIHSNFVCLVFAMNKSHVDWVSKMENVLFTTSPEDFYEFAEMKMITKDIINFAHRLESKNGIKFKLNENSLLNFPLIKE